MRIFALFGLAFLPFLAGLEIDKPPVSPHPEELVIHRFQLVGGRGAGPGLTVRMDDITALASKHHHRFRVGFARPDDAQSPEELEAIWMPLALHLDIHADAEEENS